MTENTKSRFHRYGVSALSAGALLILCAILFLWAWNALAAGLFGLPRADFKHALAFEAALAGLVLLTAWAVRLGRGGRSSAPGEVP